MSVYSRDGHIFRFVVVLFIITGFQNQLRCHGWITDKEECNTVAVGKTMELEIIMLIEISQTQDDKYHKFSLILGSR